ncbi:hypothetical protein PV350_41960 [Streptomyces sp. PA03-6a]|nr:hypothetical protein [Streptomyces sp. PA03-6a]
MDEEHTDHGRWGFLVMGVERSQQAEGHVRTDQPARYPARRRTKLGVAAVVVLVVGAHLGLGGLLLTSGPWKHWAVGALVAVVLAKTVFLLLRRGRNRGHRGPGRTTKRVPHRS